METQKMSFNEDMGTDYETGTKLFVALNLQPYEIKDPITSGKIKEITEFLAEHPDPDYVMERIKYNKSPNMSNIDYLLSYVKLYKKRAELSRELEKVNKELEYYG